MLYPEFLAAQNEGALFVFQCFKAFGEIDESIDINGRDCSFTCDNQDLWPIDYLANEKPEQTKVKRKQVQMEQ